MLDIEKSLYNFWLLNELSNVDKLFNILVYCYDIVNILQYNFCKQSLLVLGL